jgi:hypothetical protein
MKNELTVINEDTKLVPIFGANPKQMIDIAAQMATTLADVIKRQNLAIKIGQQYYVKVDGWAVLCSMMGCLPTEKSVVETSPGIWEAVVELLNIKNGQVVARGSAICSFKEKRWSNADDYARRSMAITRATGKACRLGLGWIMHMAGYESTPAEEVDGLGLDFSRSNGNINSTDSPHGRDTKSCEYKSSTKQVNSVDIVSIFRELKVSSNDLETYLNKPISQINDDDMVKLRNVYQDIRSGSNATDILHNKKIVAVNS